MSMPPKKGSRTSGINRGLCSINSDSFSNWVSLVLADELLSLKVVSKTPVLLELGDGAAVVILADSLVFSDSEGIT